MNRLTRGRGRILLVAAFTAAALIALLPWTEREPPDPAAFARLELVSLDEDAATGMSRARVAIVNTGSSPIVLGITRDSWSLALTQPGTGFWGRLSGGAPVKPVVVIPSLEFIDHEGGVLARIPIEDFERLHAIIGGRKAFFDVSFPSGRVKDADVGAISYRFSWFDWGEGRAAGRFFELVSEPLDQEAIQAGNGKTR